jgi:hypothetical protein
MNTVASARPLTGPNILKLSTKLVRENPDLLSSATNHWLPAVSNADVTTLQTIPR